MTVLKIISIILVIIFFIKMISIFNNHCEKKFNFKFFSTSSFIIAATSVALAGGGYEWYKYSLLNNGDTLNGIILISLSVIILCILVYHNYKKTNLLYGSLGTILQLGLFIPIAYIGMPLIILTLIAIIANGARVKPVRIVK